MSRPFSLFFIVFLKKVWVRQGSHGNGDIFPDRRFSCVPPSASAQRRQKKRPGLSKPGHSIRHRFISVFPCRVGCPPRPEHGAVGIHPAHVLVKAPAPYPRRSARPAGFRRQLVGSSVSKQLPAIALADDSPGSGTPPRSPPPSPRPAGRCRSRRFVRPPPARRCGRSRDSSTMVSGE